MSYKANFVSNKFSFVFESGELDKSNSILNIYSNERIFFKQEKGRYLIRKS
jgi:hypothetical protein